MSGEDRMRIGLCGTGGFAREVAPLALAQAEAGGVCFLMLARTVRPSTVCPSFGRTKLLQGPPYRSLSLMRTSGAGSMRTCGPRAG